jgi:hypothetical protein
MRLGGLLDACSSFRWSKLNWTDRDLALDLIAAPPQINQEAQSTRWASQLEYSRAFGPITESSIVGVVVGKA